MKLLDLCLEMTSDSKNYFGYLVDGIFSRGHTIKTVMTWKIKKNFSSASPEVIVLIQTA